MCGQGGRGGLKMAKFVRTSFMDGPKPLILLFDLIKTKGTSKARMKRNAGIGSP